MVITVLVILLELVISSSTFANKFIYNGKYNEIRRNHPT